VGDTVTYAIELAVGLASLAAAAGVRRTGRLTWLAGVLLVAGLAACVHAAVELLG